MGLLCCIWHSMPWVSTGQSEISRLSGISGEKHAARCQTALSQPRLRAPPTTKNNARHAAELITSKSTNWTNWTVVSWVLPCHFNWLYYLKLFIPWEIDQKQRVCSVTMEYIFQHMSGFRTLGQMEDILRCDLGKISSQLTEELLGKQWNYMNFNSFIWSQVVVASRYIVQTSFSPAMFSCSSWGILKPDEIYSIISPGKIFSRRHPDSFWRVGAVALLVTSRCTNSIQWVNERKLTSPACACHVNLRPWLEYLLHLPARLWCSVHMNVDAARIHVSVLEYPNFLTLVLMWQKLSIAACSSNVKCDAEWKRLTHSSVLATLHCRIRSGPLSGHCGERLVGRGDSGLSSLFPELGIPLIACTGL